MNPRFRGGNIEGFQSEARSISALPVRIDYQSHRYEHFMRPVGDDWLLCFSQAKGQWNSGTIRETTNLDPYAIRDAFDSVETAEEATRFLSECGRFWKFEQLLWSQFREWKSFFQWMRLDPKQACKTPEGKRAWDTAGGLGNSFFGQTDAEFSRSRFPSDAIEEIGPARWREIEIEDRHSLYDLRRFALHPIRAHEGSQVSLSWYDPKDTNAPEDWKARRKRIAKGTGLEPFMRVEALCIIEAIAATLFADRADGLRYAKCKQCRRLFKIESDHGQQFCPAPSHLKSSPCKNAYLQHERRKTERLAIEFILDSWDRGLSKKEIQISATRSGRRLTPPIWNRAQRKHQKA
jgi:hypothetical protein